MLSRAHIPFPPVQSPSQGLGYETGLTPDPIPRTENRQNFIAKFFFGDFKKPCLYLPNRHYHQAHPPLSNR
jgi:hypothetical protein